VPEPCLSAERISIAFGAGSLRVQVLNDVSVTFPRGTLSVIMGPSGSGKTTLLCVLGCLLTPDRGRVLLAGREVGCLPQSRKVAIRRREIGFIFQSFRLIASLSALDNVALGGRISGLSPREAEESARRLLACFGLGAKFQAKPETLSGGEKQRVAIARALAKRPRVLLADEPTASLDATAGQDVAVAMRRLANEGITVVVVTHDARWLGFADQVVALADGCTVEGGTG
jgi:putative ABC transport system ATP-binding protein